MKKIICLLLPIIFILSLAACSKTQSGNSDELLTILKSDKKFISEDGESIYLKDFVYGSDEATEYYAMPQEYAFVDLDNDGVDELVADITPNQVYYMVFHCVDEKVYGFLLSRRSLQSLKEDGSFMQSSGAASNYYCKMEFNNVSYKIVNTAIKDETSEIYEIYGKESPLDDVNKYIEDWHSKKDIIWTDIS